MPLDAIWAFTGSYRFLSNFYIEPDGTHVEGEFQAEKCVDAVQRQLILRAAPAQAKRMGRSVLLRPDWNAIRVDVMRRLVIAKFKDHIDLQLDLLRTRPAYLQEGNTWGDTFWGVCDGVGENWLGRILMDVRMMCDDWIPY